MNNLKLFAIGMILFLTVAPFFLVGCASAPICPEITVKFCPVR